MTPDPVSVAPDCGLEEAIHLLIENEISGVPVVDADGGIVGVLTEADLLKTYQVPEARTVADLMTRDPITFDIDADLVEIVDCVMSNGFRRVLVREQGRLAGLVSRADLMPAVLDLLLERHSSPA